MKQKTRAVKPGDRFIDQSNDEELTVVDIETWAEGWRVALLEYEDGTPWDEGLAGDGALPNPPYTPIPDSEPGATLAEACHPHEHVFDVEPSKRPAEKVMCTECNLSSSTLGNFLGHPTWERLPGICSYCEAELTADDERLFTEGEFICTECCGTNYNGYVGCATDELQTTLLHCSNNPISYPYMQVQDDGCGFVAAATSETTRRFLDAPYDHPDDSDGGEPCPECGDSVTFSHLTKRTPEAGLFRIVLDGVRDVEDLLNTEPGDSGVAERVNELFPDGNSSRVLSDETLEVYVEFCRRYNEEAGRGWAGDD